MKSAGLMLFVAGIYVWIAWDLQANLARPWAAFAWFGYVLANVGFALDALQGAGRLPAWMVP